MSFTQQPHLHLHSHSRPTGGRPPHPAAPSLVRRRLLRPCTLAASSQSAMAATSTDERPRLLELDAHSAARAVDPLDCLLLDCDGVLWTGSRVVPGAPEALRRLRERGKRLLFVTNNASKSRAAYRKKFESLGLDVAVDEIISASYAAAAYLQSQGFGAPGDRRKVLVLGQEGVEQELDAAGIPWVGGSAWQPPLLATGDEMMALQLDADIGAVLVSWDPAFSYSRLVYVCACLRELPGCLYVATNPDDADVLGRPPHAPQPGAPLPGQRRSSLPGQDQPAGNGVSSSGSGGGSALRMMPGTGCIVAAVSAAAARQPVVVGKGGPWLLPHLLQTHKLEPRRTAMVGDRVDTDIAFGLEGGLTTILTHGTGVTTLERALATPPHAAPHFLVPSITVLAGLQ